MKLNHYFIFSFFSKFKLPLFFFFFSFSILFSKQLSLDVFAKNAILINAETGVPLYEKGINQKIFPASITKIATALYVLDEKQDRLNEWVEVSKEALHKIDPRVKVAGNFNYPSYWLETDGTSFGLVVGEIITMRSLLYALMMVSGNDCANVIAEACSKSVPFFINDLNVYLEKCGLENTHFTNPHGLHHPDHYTTVKDMALLSQRALKFPSFKKIVSTLSYTTTKTNKQKRREISQYNRLIKEGKYQYKYAIGVKTGYHSKAGYNLVGAATYEGRTLIAVLAGGEKSEYRYIDAKRLFDAAFAERKKNEKIFDAGKVFLASVEGGSSTLKAELKDDFIYEYYPAEKVDFKIEIKWNDLILPIPKGSPVGFLQLLNPEGTILYEKEIFSQNNVNRKITFIIKQFFNKIF